MRPSILASESVCNRFAEQDHQPHHDRDEACCPILINRNWRAPQSPLCKEAALHVCPNQESERADDYLNACDTPESGIGMRPLHAAQVVERERDENESHQDAPEQRREADVSGR